MRNKNSKVAATKLYLCKCDGVCITYSKIQYTYAMKLEKDQSIISIRVNVDLDGYKDSKYPERTYTSDFVCVKDTGDLMVRECIERKLLQKQMTIRLLDGSREYWKTHGVSDWGIVIDEEQIV